jgi:hypothetical protein
VLVAWFVRETIVNHLSGWRTAKSPQTGYGRRVSICDSFAITIGSPRIA